MRTLREHFHRVNIIVPFWAKSAATLCALGGSTIIMDEFGEFGPLDVQLTKDDELPDSEPQSGLIDEYSLNTVENRAIELYQRMMYKLLRKNDIPDNDEEIDIRIKKSVLSKQVFEYISNLYKPLFEQIDPYKIGEKASEISKDYYESLTELSMLLFNDPGTYAYIGFFDKKLLEKKKEMRDTNNIAQEKDSEKTREEKKNETKESKK